MSNSLEGNVNLSLKDMTYSILETCQVPLRECQLPLRDLSSFLNYNVIPSLTKMSGSFQVISSPFERTVRLILLTNQVPVTKSRGICFDLFGACRTRRKDSFELHARLPLRYIPGFVENVMLP